MLSAGETPGYATPWQEGFHQLELCMHARIHLRLPRRSLLPSLLPLPLLLLLELLRARPRL